MTPRCSNSHKSTGLASFAKALVHEGGSNRPTDVKRSTHQFLPPNLGSKQLTLLQTMVQAHVPKKRITAHCFVYSQTHILPRASRAAPPLYVHIQTMARNVDAIVMPPEDKMSKLVFANHTSLEQYIENDSAWHVVWILFWETTVCSVRGFRCLQLVLSLSSLTLVPVLCGFLTWCSCLGSGFAPHQLTHFFFSSAFLCLFCFL